MPKNLKWKALITIVLVALSIWKLYPPKKTINLGLDLKGGMHLVLQVDFLDYFKNKAVNIDADFEKYTNSVTQTLSKSQENIILVLEDAANNQGIELFKYFPDYLDGKKEKTNNEILQTFWSEAQDAPEKAKEIIRRRVDTFGVSEPLIHTEGRNRIIVQLPGIKEKSRAKKLIGKTAMLQFRLVSDDREKTLESMQGKIPPGYELLYEERDEVSLPLLVQKQVKLTGSRLKKATPAVGEYGQPIIGFTLDKKGGKIFALVTQENIGRRLAIVLDGDVLMAPVIQTAIPDGSGRITGKFSQTEVQDISNVLNAGALPAKVHIIEDRTISPTLGKDSIKKGVMSALIGLALVALFMAVYYLINGLVANFALCLNILFIFAGLAWFDATLTLPGIAGIILTIGMAVDANVLINERIREERALGKKLSAAIVSGYDKAFLTILDANLTTLFASLVLFIFGTGPVRGFAVTLSIGIIASMFTAIFVTRMVIDLLIGTKKIKNLPMLQIIKETKIDFLSKKNFAYLLSIILIVASLVMAFTKGKACLGIDFSGGELVQIKFDNPQKIETIRDSLKIIGLETSHIQAFSNNKDYIIRTEMGSIDKLVEHLRSSFSETPFEIMRTEEVGPVIGAKLQQQALMALGLALLIMIIYISYRFEFKFALAGIIAIFHDVAIATGFCIMTGRQLSLPIIAALLAIIGYSINDTIVIYDRIREDRKFMPKASFNEIVNKSINQTLSRTLLTSFTTLIVVAGLYFFGGEVINDFAFTMLVGIITGTYSTIYIASALAAQWHK